MLVAAWLVLGYALFGRTSFAPAFDAMGTLGVATILGLMGAAMTIGGIRSVLHVGSSSHNRISGISRDNGDYWIENDILDRGYGIDVRSEGSGQSEFNDIDLFTTGNQGAGVICRSPNNTITGQHTNNETGIVVQENSTVVGTRCSGNEKHGILDAGGNNVITSNHVEGNGGENLLAQPSSVVANNIS